MTPCSSNSNDRGARSRLVDQRRPDDRSEREATERRRQRLGVQLTDVYPTMRRIRVGVRAVMPAVDEARLSSAVGDREPRAWTRLGCKSGSVPSTAAMMVRWSISTHHQTGSA